MYQTKLGLRESKRKGWKNGGGGVHWLGGTVGHVGGWLLHEASELETVQPRDHTVVRDILYRALRVLGNVQEGPSRVPCWLPTRT